MEDIGFWACFQSLVQGRVEEGNLVAGERFWEVLHSPGAAAALIIRSTRNAAEAVSCSFDFQGARLTCTPGCLTQRETLTFHLVPEKECRLRRGEWEGTVDQALDAILDQLVWARD